MASTPDPPAPAASVTAGERRHVSVLFADMVGYTTTLESLSEDQSFAFVQAVYDRLASCVRDYDGSVHAFGGDSVMAVFGVSDTSEDAALKACRAALSIQTAFGPEASDISARFGVQPRMRVGVSSGIAVVAAVDTESAARTTIGNAVNLASRIEARAPAGGSLICDATRRLIEWQVEVKFHAEEVIKGVAKPQKLWRLLSIHDNASRFDTSRGRGLSPLVGRADNLAAIRAAFCGSFDAFADAAYAEVEAGKLAGDFLRILDHLREWDEGMVWALAYAR